MIREKAQAGESNYAIGKEMGISRNTAKKYLQPQDEATTKIDCPAQALARYNKNALDATLASLLQLATLFQKRLCGEPCRAVIECGILQF